MSLATIAVSRRTKLYGPLTAVSIVLGSSLTAQAGVAGQQIIGVFSNIDYQGNILNDPTVGVSTFTNNSGSPDATNNAIINNGISSSTLTWGTDTANPVFNSSVLTFAGGTTTGNSDTFSVGTITFLNGTSVLDSLIFGATLSFYAGTVAPADFLGSDDIIISTTNNQYAASATLTPAQLATDADYINICGNSSNICNTSIEAYEDVDQWYVAGFPFNPSPFEPLVTPVTATLMGDIVGDPQLTLTSVQLDGDQSLNGALGIEAPQTAVPEPASLAVLASSLVGLAVIRRRRRKAL